LHASEREMPSGIVYSALMIRCFRRTCRLSDRHSRCDGIGNESAFHQRSPELANLEQATSKHKHTHDRHTSGQPATAASRQTLQTLRQLIHAGKQNDNKSDPHQQTSEQATLQHEATGELEQFWTTVFNPAQIVRTVSYTAMSLPIILYT
jgi:hypothetical protein